MCVSVCVWDMAGGDRLVPNDSRERIATPSAESYGHNIVGFLFRERGWCAARDCADGKLAFRDAATEETITYAELETAVKKLALAMREDFMLPNASTGGKEKKRRRVTVGIVAPNSYAYCVVWLAAAASGIVVTMANPAYTAEELKAQFADAGVDAVFTVNALMDRVREAAETSISVYDIDTYVREKRRSGESSIETTADNAWIAEMDVEADILCLPYSSGTSGTPKGVMLSHRNVVANIVSVIRGDTTVLSIRYDDVVLGVLPFYHIYAMTCVMLTSLCCGATVSTLPKFEPSLFLRALNEHKISIGFLAPPLMGFLAKYPAVDAKNIHLRDVVCGAAPLGAELALAVRERIPSLESVRQGYGMTELSPVSHAGPYASTKYGSIGKMIPNVECKIIGESGELCVRGPNVMLGYLNNDEATRACIDSDGFMHTGDVATVDDEGYFFIIDRVKELIKVKGFQVAPAELENVLMTHEGVVDAAVIGVPASSVEGVRDTDGEAIKAYVVLKDEGGKSMSTDDVKAYVAARVAEYKWLTDVKFVSQIPKSGSGKILRREIRAGKLD